MPILDFTDRDPLEERNKLPKPSNFDLRKLFNDVDKVIIKDDGVYENMAISNKILLRITAVEKIEKFHTLLEINEAITGFYCMCAGTYAIDFIC